MLELKPAQHALDDLEDILRVKTLPNEFSKIIVVKTIRIIKEVQYGQQLLQDTCVGGVTEKLLNYSLPGQPL